ncbi:MAG TPA: UbiA family prenyltransferase, partial [Opitutaceae bacterium]|nr:UbiA family prenyltransferase [Opitutaceae bacterium]
DYSAVHFPMLPVRDESGGKVAIWSFAAALALVLVSVLPTVLGLASAWYGAAAFAVGACFLWAAAAFLRPASRDAGARRLFLFSLAYLPLLLGLLVGDRLLARRP